MNVFESIMKGLNEALEYEKGNGTARTVTLSTDDADAKKESEDKPLLTKR